MTGETTHGGTAVAAPIHVADQPPFVAIGIACPERLDVPRTIVALRKVAATAGAMATAQLGGAMSACRTGMSARVSTPHRGDQDHADTGSSRPHRVVGGSPAQRPSTSSAAARSRVIIPVSADRRSPT